MSVVYRPIVHSTEVTYQDFNGVEFTEKLKFYLDPLALLSIMSTIKMKPASRSGNPARRNADPELSDDAQFTILRDLATQAAGTMSADASAWLVDDYFADSLAGRAFLALLASSDAQRKEFSEKVVLEPFRSFMEYARADSTNSKGDMTNLEDTLKSLEKVFVVAPESELTVAERKARLEAGIKPIIKRMIIFS